MGNDSVQKFEYNMFQMLKLEIAKLLLEVFEKFSLFSTIHIIES